MKLTFLPNTDNSDTSKTAKAMVAGRYDNSFFSDISAIREYPASEYHAYSYGYTYGGDRDVNSKMWEIMMEQNKKYRSILRRLVN